MLGYDIRLGEDGLRGLRQALPDAEWNKVKSKLGTGQKSVPTICDSRMRAIFDLGSIPGYPESYPMARARLRDILLSRPSRAGILHFSKAVAQYIILRDGPTEKVELEFTDGTRETGDLVIAADGSKSTLNHLTGLRNRYVTDIRCITARIKLSSPEVMPELPRTLREGPVIFGLGERSLCYSCVNTPVEGGKEEATLMVALAVGAKFWKRTLGYDPEEAAQLEKTDQGALFETALDLVDHWRNPELQGILTVDPVSSIGYGPFRSSIKPSPRWREVARQQIGPDAGAERIWFMGDSIHAMTRTLSYEV